MNKVKISDSVFFSILGREKEQNSLKKHYFLAPNEKTEIELKKYFKNNYENLAVVSDFLPMSLEKKDEQKRLEKIIKTKPNYVWLGIGSPKQIELATYLKRHAKGMKIFCVGAALEFLTGQKKQAPILMQKSGLEWLFRLVSEPNRLWKRYLVTIPKYLLRLLWRKISPQKN